MPTKVFYLITGVHVGGAEKLLLSLVKHLDRSRFEPVVASLLGGELAEAFEEAGVRVYDLKMRGKWDAGVLWRLKRALDNERPVILHTHLFHADVIGRLVGTWSRIPVIVNTQHMVELFRHGGLEQEIDKATSGMNDAHAVVSEEVMRGLVRIEGLDPKGMVMIPNGVESPRKADAEDVRRRREELGIGADAPLIGIVSRLEEPRKGHRFLFEAIQLLSQRFNALHCAVIGDGPARVSLESQVQKLGIEDRVTFLGTRHDVDAWLAALDVFAFPSLLEGAPMVVLEAMAAGCPVVTTDVGGITEAVTHEESALIVPCADSKALAAAIARLLEDKALALRLGACAKKQFEERFEAGITAGKTQEWYDGLLEQKGKRPLKILEVVTTLDRGGVSTYLATMIQALPKDRFSVSLACGPDEFHRSLARRLGVPIHKVGFTKPLHPLKDLIALWQLCAVIRRVQPDIVHSNMSKSDFIAGMASRLCGVPCAISTAHGALRLTDGPSLKQTFFDALEWFIYRHFFDRVISVSDATTQELMAKKKVTPAQVTTIPNGIPAFPVQDRDSRERLRRSLGIASHQPIITMVSRLKVPKTPEVLIESMNLLVRLWPELVCLLVGDGPDGPVLRERIRRYGLEDSVRLLGQRDDVAELLGISDLFVLSSYSEGLPMSVLEAMAAGLPVVASRVGGLAELIHHGRTGWLVPPQDVKALAEQIDDLLRRPAFRKRVADAGREEVQARFNVRQQVERTQAIFRQGWLEKTAKRPAPVRGDSGWTRMKRFIAEEGAAEAFARLGRKLVNPFHHAASIWFLDHKLSENFMRMGARMACSIRKAALSDLDALAAVSFESRQAVAKALASNKDVCFIAENEGKIMAIQWVALGEQNLNIEPLERAVHLRKEEAYLYNCRAFRAYRAQGVIPAVEAEVVQWLRANGYRMLYTDIRSDNQPSLKTFEKLAFRKIEQVSIKRWTPFFTRIKSERPRALDPSPIRIAVLGDEARTGSILEGLERHDPRFIRITHTIRAVASLSTSAWRWLKQLSELVRRLRADRCELIHCESFPALRMASLAARLAGVRHLTVTLDTPKLPLAALPGFRQGVDAYSRRLLRRADRIFFFSESLKEHYLAQKLITPQQVQLIDAAWNGHNEAALQSPAELRKRFGIKDERPVVGTVVSLAEEAEPRRFLALCERLKEEKQPQWQFLMAGDGPLYLLLKQHAQELGLSDSIRFVRRDYDRKSILTAVDVFVDASETLEGALMFWEAQAKSKTVMRLGADTDLASAAEHLRFGAAATVPQEIGDGRRDAQYRLLQCAAVWQALIRADIVETAHDHWRKLHGSGTSF